jgi:hypothetical protein
MEKNKIKIINFNASYEVPNYKYDAKRNLIHWGSDNAYPDYLLDVYNAYGSTTHKAIVNRKTKLTAGQGWKDVESLELEKFIKDNNLNKEVRKVSLDYELYNGFALEIIWNREGTEISSVSHVPFHKLRIGIESEDIPFEHYWYSDDWSKYKKPENEPNMYRAWNPYVKSGKSLYYYSEYNPQTDGLYPIPGYSTSMNFIEMDYEVGKFHLNQVKQGYSPSFILNFASGIPTAEEQDMFYKEFKRNYSGTDNAGKIILTYSEGTEQKPELTPIQLNDSDDRFILLQEVIERNIVMGAEIPPQLVVLTPGKLGSSDEREELQKEFQQSYIQPRQNVIEEVFNEVLYTDEMVLKDYNHKDEDEGGKEEDLSVQENAQAQLKGSVGGVQGILSIQTSVSEGTTTIDSGAAILELIYGIDPMTARRMLGEPKKIDNNTENNNI